MGRPSKCGRNGSEASTTTTTSDVTATPVNLSFHASARQLGPAAAADGPRRSEVTAQLPDSTVDRCGSLQSRKRPLNVLRQLQSPSRTTKTSAKQSCWWGVGGENMVDRAVERVWSLWNSEVGTDLRVKHARHPPTADMKVTSPSITALIATDCSNVVLASSK